MLIPLGFVACIPRKGDESVFAEGEEEKSIRHSAPLLSKVRFGPGVLSVLSFIAFMAALLYILGHLYLAAAFGAIGALLLGVKSMEIIQLGHPEQRQLVGRRCLVLNGVEKGKVGVAPTSMTERVSLIPNSGQLSLITRFRQVRKRRSSEYGRLCS